MLYHLLTPLSDGGDVFNLFRYITFRAGGAFFTALLIGFLFGRPVINWLRKVQKKGQPIRDDGKTPEYFVLRIERILMKETWAKNLQNGATMLPNIPLAYGFRDGAKFWFAEHKKPFWFPTPTDKGPKEEAVLYEANRLDPENVQFTRDACKQLTGIPRPFLKTALKGIIKRAKADGVSVVDLDYVKKLNEERES